MKGKGTRQPNIQKDLKGDTSKKERTQKPTNPYLHLNQNKKSSEVVGRSTIQVFVKAS